MKMSPFYAEGDSIRRGGNDGQGIFIQFAESIDKGNQVGYTECIYMKGGGR